MLGGSVGGIAGSESFRLVDLRAGSLRCRRDRTARRRRAASDVQRGRARDGASDRDGRPRRAARRHVSLSDASGERRRRSPAIRTEFRRAAREETLARVDADAIRAWHRERALSSASVIARRGRRGSRRAGAAGGARIRRASTRSRRGRSPRRLAVAPDDERRAARSRADGAGVALPGPIAQRSRSLFGGDDRERGEWAGRPVLRRAARQAIAVLHGARVRVRATARRDVRGVHRDVAGAGRRRARRVARRIQAAARRAGDGGRARAGADATRSGRTRFASRAAARCWPTWSTRISSGRSRSISDYDAQVRAVTAESMQRVALEHFDPSRRAEGIVRGKR